MGFRQTKTARFLGLFATAVLALTALAPDSAWAQLTAPVASTLTYPDCPNMQSSDFAAVQLVRRGSGGTLDSATNEPLKMALDMNAQGKVDVYFVQRYGMIRKYDGTTQTTVTLGNLGFGQGTSLTDSTQICFGCASNGSNFNSSEGLMGIALDPSFKTNGWIYLYTTIKSVWRVTRYKLTGTVLDMSSGKVIWRVTAGSFTQHMGGAIRFDGAGNLWISVSDNASTGNTTAPYAPDLRYFSANTNSPFGKIMRIKPRALPDGQAAPAPGPGSTYDIPAGNLRNQFLQIGGRASQDTTKILPEIYVMGARNAYTLAIDSVRNAVAWGDVGPDQYPSNSTNVAQQSEEFNFTKRPGFFGYPYWVGGYNGGITMTMTPIPSGSTQAKPFTNYTSATVSHTGIDSLPPARPSIAPYGKACAVTGPIYYYNPASTSTVKFPPHFHGAWFVGDFNQSWIDVLRFNSSADSVVQRMKAFVSTSSSLASGYLSTVANTSMATGNGLLELEMGPDGALYVLHYGGYRTNSAATGIFRIEYRGTCRPTSVSVAFQRERSGVEMASLNGKMLHVTATGDHRVEMRDASGRLLWARGAPGAADYDLGSLNGSAGSGRGTMGLRILTVTASGERFVRKFMQ
jgi:glucose/arabinose dehydrogenase